MKVADIEFLPIKDLFYLGLQPYGYGNAGDGAADRDRTGCADTYKTVAMSVNSLGSRGDNFNVMAQAGELLLQTGDMTDYPTGIGEIIW